MKDVVHRGVHVTSHTTEESHKANNEARLDVKTQLQVDVTHGTRHQTNSNVAASHSNTCGEELWWRYCDVCLAYCPYFGASFPSMCLPSLYLVMQTTNTECKHIIVQHNTAVAVATYAPNAASNTPAGFTMVRINKPLFHCHTRVSALPHTTTLCLTKGVTLTHLWS